MRDQKTGASRKASESTGFEGLRGHSKAFGPHTQPMTRAINAQPAMNCQPTSGKSMPSSTKSVTKSECALDMGQP